MIAFNFLLLFEIGSMLTTIFINILYSLISEAKCKLIVYLYLVKKKKKVIYYDRGIYFHWIDKII